MNPSYPIVFYVSGHGFGHSSRIIEVVRAVLGRLPSATIVIKTSAPRRLFASTLGNSVEIVELVCDAGMIQPDSLHIDVRASLQEAKAFQRRLPQLAAREAAFLAARDARVVVGDIPPLAFAASRAASVPSIAIGNFTWDWIYEGYPEEFPDELAAEIRTIYRSATKVLRLPISAGFSGLEGLTMDIPFIARQSRRDPDDVRRAIGLPPRAGDRPLVLMSFGAYGIEGLDTAAVAALKDYTVATTGSPGPGILHIPEPQLFAAGLRYEDLVRAADVVVTKPGYGIVSDAIANDAALLYTSRGRFIEYDLFVREMPRYVRAQFIEQADLLAGKWAPALERLLDQPPPPERPAANGAELAAMEILAWEP